MTLKASVIVSIYKDIEALRLVLWGLSVQTERDFEVIVTEDCEEPEVKRYLKNDSPKNLSIVHLTQEDIGFRKTRAVNRAVVTANSDYLIFLDGDCIPHPQFVEMHLKHSEQRKVLAGRRMHLGEKFSKMTKQERLTVSRLFSWTGLWTSFLALHKDRVRNFEIGAPSNFLHWLLKRHHLSIVGCNFSCRKSDMLKINGYNEDLLGVGGEDGDLEWRFNFIGVSTKNVKHQAVVYHIWHRERRESAEKTKPSQRRIN